MTVLQRRMARIFFKKMAEMKLIGKVKLFGNIPNGIFWMIQQNFGFHYYHFGNKIPRRLAGFFSKYLGEVFGIHI